MNITRITVDRLYNLGSYEHVKFSLSVDVKEGESAAVAMLGVEKIMEALNPKTSTSAANLRAKNIVSKKCDTRWPAKARMSFAAIKVTSSARPRNTSPAALNATLRTLPSVTHGKPAAPKPASCWMTWAAPPTGRTPNSTGKMKEIGMTELEFIFAPPVVWRTATIQQRFESFHKANPWVYRRLVTMARELKAKGVKHYGVKALMEVLRWQFHQQTTDPDSRWHFNNNYASRFARLIMETETDLRGFFELRELQTD